MRTVALFGLPLNRPHSAVMHNAAFEAAAIDAHYELREVDRDGLAAGVRQARDEQWWGFQVTAPHKQTVMELLDVVEPTAMRIGAVNSVERTADGELVGFNTDVIGFMAGLRACVGSDVAGARVVVAGSGGVSHAATYGLADAGAGPLTVLDIESSMSAALADELADLADLEPLAFTDPLARQRLREAEIFVNATSVGMLSPGPVVDVDLLDPAAAVFDVVYVPARTALVRQARARGMRAANGDQMLVAQAASAWMRWTGAPDPTPVMHAALAPLLDCDDLRP